jgi:predicted DNA-binding transcriptional regulator AlpA
MEPQFIRRDEAARYLRQKYGFGSKATLAKAVVVGGGPQYRKIGRLVVYEPSALDAWVTSRLGPPQKSSSKVTVPGEHGMP